MTFGVPTPAVSVEADRVVGAAGQPAFANSWGDAAASPLAVFGPLRFYKNGERVYIDGAIKGGTPGPTSVACTLPTGYRPAYTVTELRGSVSDDFSTAGEAATAVNASGELVISSADEDNVLVCLHFRVA